MNLSFRSLLMVAVLFLISAFGQLAHGSVLVAMPLGGEKSVAKKLQMSVLSALGSDARPLETTDCPDVECFLNESRTTDADLLLTFDLMDLGGIYMSTMNLYDINSGEMLDEIEAQGSSAAELNANAAEVSASIVVPRLAERVKKQAIVPKKEPAKKQEVRIDNAKHKRAGPRQFLTGKAVNERTTELAVNMQTSSNTMSKGAPFSVNYRMPLSSTSLMLEFGASYKADLGTNDLKGLANTLVQIAYEGSADTSFQQPIDKEGVRLWASVEYNFDVLKLRGLYSGGPHLLGGLGFVTEKIYYAQFNPDSYGNWEAGSTASEDQPPHVSLIPSEGSKVRIPIVWGGGYSLWGPGNWGYRFNIVNFSVRAKKPQYDPTIPETEYELRTTRYIQLGLMYRL